MKIKLNNKTFWSTIVFLSLVSIRRILLDPRHIGHNWDFSIPFLKELLIKLPNLSLYTWNKINLGVPQNFTISQIIPNFLLSIPGHFLSPTIIQKLLIVGVILVSNLNFKFLSDYLVGKKKSNLLAAVLYGFSPFLFNDLISGSWYMWISYSFIPLFLVSLIKIVRNGFDHNLLILIFSSIFVISSLQNFVLIMTTCFMYTTIEGLIKRSIVKYGRRFITISLILFLLNLYWLTVIFTTLSKLGEQVLSTSMSGNFFDIAHNLQTLSNIFNLGGFHNRNMYLNALPPLLLFAVTLASSISWIIIIKNSLNRRRISLEILTWFAIFIISILIVKGSNPPFGEFSLAIFRNTPLMSLFRSPQHLMMLPSLLTSILLAFSLKDERVSNKIFIVATVAVLLWISGWWYSGDIGSTILSKKNMDRINYYRLPSDLAKVYEENEQSKIEHRILFLPAVNSPNFTPNEYQNGGQGGQPEYMYLDHPTLNTEYNFFAAAIERQYCGGEKIDMKRLLPLLNIKYISVRKDIGPKFSDCVRNWNTEKTADVIDKEPYLEKLFDGKQANLYKVKDGNFVPKIYSPKSIIVSGEETKYFYRAFSDDIFSLDQAIIYTQQNIDKTGVILRLKDISLLTPPNIEFKQINPTKYRVRFHQAKDLTAFIFSENYDENWTIYQAKTRNTPISMSLLARYQTSSGNGDDQASLEELKQYVAKDWISTLGDGKANRESMSINYVSKNFYGSVQNNNLPNGDIRETLFSQSPEGESLHFVANGYANGWLIDPATVCQNGDCGQNPDGSYDFEIIIQYLPQHFFVVGVLISLMTLGFCFVYIFFQHRQKRKEDE